MTFAVYQDTPNGRVRIGTFTPKSRASVRVISEEFAKKYPNTDIDTIYFCRRARLMGKWVDHGELVKAEIC